MHQYQLGYESHDVVQAAHLKQKRNLRRIFSQLIYLAQLIHNALTVLQQLDQRVKPDFVQVPATSDLRRFTRYWRVAAPQLEEMAARGAP